MDLMEYQAKDLFAKHGVPVLPGDVAETPDEARAIAEGIGGPVVIKAQVKTGGRGKAGGVKLAATPDEAAEHAANILGMDIKGHTVHKVLVAQASDIDAEYYFSYLLDRTNRTFLAMASVQGGMDIEEVAANHPEALAKIPVDALTGVDEAKAREIVEAAQFPDDVADQVVAVIQQLWAAFVAEDATLVEVNPLVRTPEGMIVALDGKVSLDENADFRHPDHAALADVDAADPLEAKAKAKGLNYVKLDGEVGIIGNGAGLVMSTLDVVAYAGEEFGGVKPANFLDIGGGASADVMAERSRDHPRRPRRTKCVRQRLRRDHRMRRGRRRHRASPGDAEGARRPHRQADRRTAGRQQRRGRPADPRRGRARHGRAGRHDGWSRATSGRACGAGSLTMAIFLNQDSRILVQGITGSEGGKHTRRMVRSGSKIVAGCTPGKGGQTVDGGAGDIPVFDTVAEAVEKTGANVSVIFVPPRFAKAAVMETIDAGVPLCVVITEGIPVHDTAGFFQYAERLWHDPAGRPELPGADHARPVQRRHHPGRHHPSGPDRPGLEVGDADVPDDVRAPRHRILDCGRHRR